MNENLPKALMPMNRTQSHHLLLVYTKSRSYVDVEEITIIIEESK